MIGRIGHEKAGSAAMRDEQGRHTGGSHDIVSSRKVMLIVGKGKAQIKFTKHKPDRDETRFIRTLHAVGQGPTRHSRGSNRRWCTVGQVRTGAPAPAAGA